MNVLKNIEASIQMLPSHSRITRLHFSLHVMEHSSQAEMRALWAPQGLRVESNEKSTKREYKIKPKTWVKYCYSFFHENHLKTLKCHSSH